MEKKVNQQISKEDENKRIEELFQMAVNVVQSEKEKQKKKLARKSTKDNKND